MQTVIRPKKIKISRKVQRVISFSIPRKYEEFIPSSHKMFFRYEPGNLILSNVKINETDKLIPVTPVGNGIQNRVVIPSDMHELLEGYYYGELEIINDEIVIRLDGNEIPATQIT